MKINSKIEKEAERLKLRILNYNGFVRGRVWDGEMNHCGMWEFDTLPLYETDEEPMSVGGFNIEEALDQMEETAIYFYS